MEIIIKLDHDEPVKVNTSSIYGEQHPLPDWDPEKLRDEIKMKKRECDQLIHTIKNLIHTIKNRDDQLHHLRIRQDELLMKLQNKDDEIQDFKLENDRLKQRDELMLKFISDLYDQLSDKDSLIMQSELIRTMVTLRKQLEAL